MSSKSLLDICLYYNYNFPISISLSLRSIMIPIHKINSILKSLWSSLDINSLYLNSMNDLINTNLSYLSLFRLINTLETYIPNTILKIIYWHICITNIQLYFGNIFDSIFDELYNKIDITDIIYILTQFEINSYLYIYEIFISFIKKYLIVKDIEFPIYNVSIDINKLQDHIIHVFKIQGYNISSEIFDINNFIGTEKYIYGNDIYTKYILMKIPKLNYTNDFIKKLNRSIKVHIALKRIEFCFLSIFRLPNRDIIGYNISDELIDFILNESTKLLDISSINKNCKYYQLLQDDISDILISKFLNIKDTLLNLDKSLIYNWFISDKNTARIIMSECVYDGICIDKFKDLFMCRVKSLNL